MSGPQPRHPSALVSWSHTDQGWSASQITARRDAVHPLATALRRNGIDADVDLYHLSSSADWTRWGPGRLVECDFVIVVVSDSWRLAWEGRGDPTKGAGAAAEADALRSIYAVDRDAFLDKVRLVLLPGANNHDIPTGMHGVARFRLESIDDAGLSALLRSLTEQPEFIKGELGDLPILPPAAHPHSGEPRASTSSAVPAETVPSQDESGTRGQRNALAKAGDYLRQIPFSEKGLLNQLISEGFSAAESEFAVANVGASWMTRRRGRLVPTSRKWRSREVAWSLSSVSTASARQTPSSALRRSALTETSRHRGRPISTWPTPRSRRLDSHGSWSSTASPRTRPNPLHRQHSGERASGSVGHGCGGTMDQVLGHLGRSTQLVPEQ